MGFCVCFKSHSTLSTTKETFINMKTLGNKAAVVRIEGGNTGKQLIDIIKSLI